MNHLASLFKRKQKSSSSKDSLASKTDQGRRKVFLRYVNRAWLVFGLLTLTALPIFPERHYEFIFLAAITFSTYLIIRFLNLNERTQAAGVVFTLAANYGFYGLFMVEVRKLGADQAFESEATLWMLMGLAVLFAGAFVHKWAAPILAALNTILLVATRLSIAPQSDPRPAPVVFWWMLAITIWLYESTLHEALGQSWTEVMGRKQIEDELRRAEVKYRTLVEQIHPIVYTSSPHQHIGVTYISPQIKTLGFTQEEWVADPELWLRQVHPDDREKVIQEIEALSRDGQPHKLEYRLRARDGAVRWFLDEVMDIKDENGDILFRQGFMLDITDRRNVEEAIQTTNTLLEQTLEQSPVPMVLVSFPDGIIRSANSACRHFLGFDEEPSPIGTRLAELKISWQDFDMNGNPGTYKDLPLPRSLAGLKSGPEERHIIRKDGTSVYGLVYGSPIFDSTGSLIAGYLVMIDITERKQAEERYRNLFNTIEEGVAINEAIFDEQGEAVDYMILDVNPAFERHSPYKREEALGNRATNLYRMNSEFINAWWKEHTQKAQVAQTEYYHEPSGRWFFITTTVPEGARFATIFIDITERKRTEEAIQQRLNEQTILHQVSQSLLTVHLDLETIYTTLHEAVVQIMPCEAFNIVLDDKSGGDYHAVYLFDVNHRFSSQRIPRGQGLSGRVISDGETLFIHDNQQSNVPAVRYGTSNSVRSILAVPLRKENETIGMVTAQSYQPNVYNERHRVLLETLAAQVTTVIENARLFEETARRAQEFSSLFETSNKLSAEYDLNALLRSIVENAKSLLHAASSGMYLITPGKDGLELTVDTQPYIPFGTRLQIGEGLAGRVAQTRSPLRVEDYSNWEGRSPLYEATPMRAVLEVPMLYKGELIGVLTADEIGDSTRKFTETDEHLLSLFASQAAGAIHSARLRDETVNRLRELGLLYESGLTLGQLSSSKVIAQKIINLLDQKMDWHHTTIRLHHPESETLELLAFNQPALKDDAERSAVEQRLRSVVMRSGQGLSGWVVQHGQVVRSNEVKNDPRYVETFSGIRCGLYVPIMIAEKVIGVICIESEEENAFSESDERLTVTLAAQAAIAMENAQLLTDLQHSHTNLTSAYDATIEGWSRAMDLRDKETEGHTLRVTELTLKLAGFMGFNEEEMIQIRRGGLLHDIGKLGVPDNILLKEEDLTESEWEIMRKHPIYAYEMLSSIDYLAPALTIPYCHHEKWDGTGYPRGLKGEEIPLAARIFSVVDVWDALTSNRPYRPSWTREKSLEYIQQQSGKYFDPKVVDTFMKLIAHPK